MKDCINVTANTSVQIARDAEIGIITIDNPPVNALGHAVREALLPAIEALDNDASIRAIVLHGAGRQFIAGADIRELEQPSQPPVLAEVLWRLESCSKLVLAALHGAVLGGGAETALACHVRCASSDLQMGFPEVKLGLIPGAGGTVRLPRLAGLRTALQLMTRGDPIGCTQAQALGLIDQIVEGEQPGAAVQYARQLLAAAHPIRRVRERSIPDAGPAAAQLFDEFRSAVATASRKSAAAERVIEAVESATSESFEGALSHARRLFELCRASTESKALRHLFLAERSAPLLEGAPLPVARVGVVGAGTMGSAIAMSFAQAGLDVRLFDTDPDAQRAGLERIRTMAESAARKGRLSAAGAEGVLSRIQGVRELIELGQVDLVIEAVFENARVKQDLFARLGPICRPEAILATNTSTLDVDAIAAASGRSADVVGMHFFSPAHVMRLIEIVRGRASSPRALATVSAVARRIGKIGVIVGNGFGFVGNRLLHAYGREKELMLLQGATPQQIDRALEAFGMAMGPNAVGDLTGLDIGASARREMRQRPDDPLYFRVSDLLVEHGRLGQKSGRGFYRYDAPGAPRQTDPEVVDLIRSEARRLEVPQRQISDEEIVERCMLALVNEGTRALEESIARCAADIDVIWCNGYGFPRARGGPMFYGDTLGADRLVARIEHYAAELGARYWKASDLLVRLAQQGRRLADFES